MRYILRLLKIGCVIYVAFLLILFFLQESLIYHPSKVSFGSCDFHYPYSTVRFGDTRMYRFDTGGSRYAVLYHGNAGSACDRDLLVDMLISSDYSVILPEYTGFGEDGRDATHAGIRSNVLDVIRYVAHENIDIALVVGESIGTGPAVMHSTYSNKTYVANTALITPFTSLSDLASSIYWFFPTSFLVENAWDNHAVIGMYAGRLLIVHGEKDEIIPIHQAKDLCQSAGAASEKECLFIEDAMHNTILSFPESRQGIEQFIKHSK